MKILTLCVNLLFVLNNFILADNVENTRETLEVVAELTELDILRNAFTQLLTCIQTIDPTSEQLYKTCIAAGALLRRKEFTSCVSLAEQLDWTMKLSRCIMQKIKSIEEHPTVVLRLEAILQSVISYAHLLLGKIKQEENTTQGAQDSTPLAF
jgi:hypothetical protein